MASKYYRVQTENGKSFCPVCGRENNHKANADSCNHIYKITETGIAYYYWGFRPEGWHC